MCSSAEEPLRPKGRFDGGDRTAARRRRGWGVGEERGRAGGRQRWSVLSYDGKTWGACEQARSERNTKAFPYSSSSHVINFTNGHWSPDTHPLIQK